MELCLARLCRRLELKVENLAQNSGKSSRCLPVFVVTEAYRPAIERRYQRDQQGLYQVIGFLELVVVQRFIRFSRNDCVRYDESVSAHFWIKSLWRDR